MHYIQQIIVACNKAHGLATKASAYHWKIVRITANICWHRHRIDHLAF